MKITKSQLRQIIKEEATKVLNEASLQAEDGLAMLVREFRPDELFDRLAGELGEDEVMTAIENIIYNYHNVDEFSVIDPGNPTAPRKKVTGPPSYADTVSASPAPQYPRSETWVPVSSGKK